MQESLALSRGGRIIEDIIKLMNDSAELGSRLAFSTLRDLSSCYDDVRIGEVTDGSEIIEKPNEIVVNLDIPSLRRESITVSLRDDRLFVSGERKAVGASDSLQSRELFSKTITLPSKASVEGIKAVYSEGTLNIRIPLQGTKQIKVE